MRAHPGFGLTGWSPHTNFTLALIGITQHIERLSNETLRLEEGSLYPALHRLAHAGSLHPEWGASENNRRARYYSITAAGPQPLTVGSVSLGVLSTLQQHVTNQEMIAVASLEGDRQLALQAMAHDPLVPSLSVAKQLLDDLIEAHAELLPQFKTRVPVAA